MPGRGGGEDLGDVAGVAVDDGLVAHEEVAAHVLALAGAGAASPLVLVGGVVHDEVHAEADAALVALLGKAGEVVHGAEVGADAAEVAHGVAPVGAALVGGRVEERHEVEVVDARPLEVVQVVLHAADGAGKVVDVHLHAEKLAVTVPRTPLAPGVKGPERLGALVVECLHLVAELGEHRAVVVELHVEPAQLVVVATQAAEERGVGARPRGGAL